MTDSDSNPVFWLAVMALARQAVRDPLTDLYNRRYFDETLGDHLAAATRYDRPLTLVLFDLNNFKSLNDARGHAAGDTALKTFARSLLKETRDADLCCRIGGDEFAVILPETDSEGAQHLIARLSDYPDIPAFTAGIAEHPADDLLRDADADLLVKKTESRRAPNQ